MGKVKRRRLPFKERKAKAEQLKAEREEQARLAPPKPARNPGRGLMVLALLAGLTGPMED